MFGKHLCCILAASFFVSLFLPSLVCGQTKNNEPEFSRSFLGAYKKVGLYPELEEYSRKYMVDPVFVLAIAMYESGGNPNLRSGANASGVMQVIESTFKEMGVSTINEAGVKYLRKLTNELSAFLQKKYGEVSISRLKSLVIQGYNGGPGRAKRSLIKVETVQYLQGVSLYFNLLSQYRKEIEEAAKGLETLVLKKDSTWKEIADRVNVSVIELRLYNPFLAQRYPNQKTNLVPKGKIITYPKKPSNIASRKIYCTKPGDILHHVANAFFRTAELNESLYDEFRDNNALLLWGVLPQGTKIDVSRSSYIEMLEADEQKEIKK